MKRAELIGGPFDGQWVDYDPSWVSDEHDVEQCDCAYCEGNRQLPQGHYRYVIVTQADGSRAFIYEDLL